MFNNLGWGEILVLGVLGILIFGPERLPKAAADAARLVRELRRMARGVTADLREEFGADLDTLRSLNPRRILDDAIDDRPDPRVRVDVGGPKLASGERPPFDPDAT